MKKAADAGMPSRPLSMQETAEIGQLLCQLFKKNRTAEVLEMVKILADAGHGGCLTRLRGKDVSQ